MKPGHSFFAFFYAKKIIILPVDQGFESTRARNYAPKMGGYDPDRYYQLVIDAGCNAYTAPLEFIGAGAHEYADKIPTISKRIGHNSFQRLKKDSIAMLHKVMDILLE